MSTTISSEQIARVRITSGINTYVSNGLLGNPNDDIVVMDDFLYAEPIATPEPATLASVLSAGALASWRRKRAAQA